MSPLALTLLETENKLPAPAWVIGLIAFAILITLLLVTMAIGKGRAHS